MKKQPHQYALGTKLFENGFRDIYFKWKTLKTIPLNKKLKQEYLNCVKNNYKIENLRKIFNKFEEELENNYLIKKLYNKT